LVYIHRAREAVRRTGTHGFAQRRHVGPREACHDCKSRVGCGSLLVEKPRFQRLDVRATHDCRNFARGNPVFEGNTHQRPDQTSEDSKYRFFLAGGFVHYVAVLSSHITLGTSDTYVN